jgi:hypothetical protein
VDELTEFAKIAWSDFGRRSVLATARDHPTAHLATKIMAWRLLASRPMKIFNRHVLLVVVMSSSACTAQVHPSSPALRPVASIQELMQEVIDPSADGVWDAVETTVTKDAEIVQQPRTNTQWLDVRRSAMTLVESTNLLAIEGRRVGVRDFPAEATGALDSAHIQDLIAAQRPTFNAFAAALREAALTTLAAIDAQDPARLVKAGGAVDQVCEGCHLRFWYPNQVIPPIR